MNLSEINPLIKKPRQRQQDQKDLLENNDQIHAESKPGWHTIFIEVKQNNGEAMKGIYRQHHDECIDCQQFYTSDL